MKIVPLIIATTGPCLVVYQARRLHVLSAAFPDSKIEEHSYIRCCLLSPSLRRMNTKGKVRKREHAHAAACIVSTADRYSLSSSLL